MLTSGVVLLHDNARIQLFTLGHCWSILIGSCLTTLLTTLISLRATATCLPTWRTDCYHSASTIMWNWWKVSKRDWAHRGQISLTQAHKNLFPVTSASITAVTKLKCSLTIIYVFLFTVFYVVAYSVNSSLEVPSEQPSYFKITYFYARIIINGVQLYMRLRIFNRFYALIHSLCDRHQRIVVCRSPRLHACESKTRRH
jgi:hypothetical protein